MAIHYKLLNKVHELSTPITSGIVSGTYLFWALHVKLLYSSLYDFKEHEKKIDHYHNLFNHLKSMVKSIAVFGGNGFLGRKICEVGVRRGYDVASFPDMVNHLKQ